VRRAVGLMLSLAACSRTPTDGGVDVKVSLASGIASKCVQVAAKAPGVELRSGPMKTAGKTLLDMGVAQGNLPAQVTIDAIGFADEACMTETVPGERSKEVAVTFVAGKILPLTLELLPGSADHDAHCGQGHADCSRDECDGLPCLNGGVCASHACTGASSEKGLCNDGVDNDGDGEVDCADADCLNATCSADKCTLGAKCDASKTCSGGTPKSCPAGSGACHAGAGTCDPATGDCVYAPADAGLACDDGNLCTRDDSCTAGGVCTGATVSCNNPPGACFTTSGAACDPVSGCSYPVAAPTTACDDAQSCTLADTCQVDGGCAGTAVVCAAGSCQSFAGQCGADGGCVFSSFDAGTSCDAGVCNAFGACIPPFGVTPSNFLPEQVPTPPGAVTLNCGDSTIYTTGTPSFANWCSQPLPGVAIIAQPGGTDAVLVSFSSLTLAVGSTLHVQGTRPLIIAATGDVTIAGNVEAVAGASGCADGGAGASGGNGDTLGGGGGGSLSTAGGSGGNGSPAFTTGSGGAPGLVDSNALLVPLRGGCPGGVGHGSQAPLAAGGGALQISIGGTLVVSGTLSAPGWGAARALASGNGGGGGGSGGVILLEALAVTMTGGAVIAANGGGGGEGAGALVDGDPGSPGAADGGAAPGGSNLFNAGGNGGVGAIRGAAAGDGTDATIGGGGGGGGGLGRIRLRTGVGCSIGTQVLFSPAPNADGGC
jgi:hypothetical protein